MSHGSARAIVLVMIRAIVFDCFGVLAREGLGPFVHDHFGDSPEKIERAMKMADETNVGRLSYSDFVTGLAGLARVSELSVRDEIENNTPNKALFEFIRNSLKPHYKIGLLSNAAADWLTDIFNLEQLKLFDAIALSYAIRAVKPEIRAYTVIADRLGVSLNECVMIDDVESCCEGARLAGMQTVHYKHVNQVIRDLGLITLGAPDQAKS
jgi:HAD superfamily hydrolase (TIGR01509 family)